jgi:hypothetical protein
MQYYLVLRPFKKLKAKAFFNKQMHNTIETKSIPFQFFDFKSI